MSTTYLAIYQFEFLSNYETISLLIYPSIQSSLSLCLAACLPALCMFVCLYVFFYVLNYMRYYQVSRVSRMPAKQREPHTAHPEPRKLYQQNLLRTPPSLTAPRACKVASLGFESSGLATSGDEISHWSRV